MNDYADLIVQLRSGEIGYELAAADALEAQARRISELGKMLAVHRLAVDVDALKARIAELEAEVACSIVSGNDAHERALGYVYELNDAAEMLANQARTLKEWHERIVELTAALKPFADIDVSDCADGHVCYFWGFGENAGKVSAAEVRAARAAYLGEKK